MTTLYPIPVWTVADIARLKRMMATGAASGRFNERQITFRSLDEMFKLLDVMEDEVNPRGRVKAVRFQTSDGL